MAITRKLPPAVPQLFKRLSKSKCCRRADRIRVKSRVKLLPPRREERLEAQQQIAEQGAPDLPTDGICTVAQKVGEFEGLLDLLEKDFNGPAGTVKIGNAAGALVHIIGEEFHLSLDAIDLHQSAHPAHTRGVFALVGTLARKHHFLVGKDLRVGYFPALENREAVAAFGAGDPENSA